MSHKWGDEVAVLLHDWLYVTGAVVSGGLVLWLTCGIFNWQVLSPFYVSGGRIGIPSTARLVDVTGIWLFGFLFALLSTRVSCDLQGLEKSSFIQKLFGRGILCAWIALIGGFPAALYTGCAVDAGRGGAIADAIGVLGPLIAIRFGDARQREFDSLEDKAPQFMRAAKAVDPATFSTAFSLLQKKLQELSFVLLLLLGTISWAYGDVVARLLQQCIHGLPTCSG